MTTGPSWPVAWLARHGFGPDEEHADSDPDDAQQVVHCSAERRHGTAGRMGP